MDEGKLIVTNSKLEGNYLKIIFNKTKEDEDVKLENLIDLDVQIEKFRQNKLYLINSNIKYKKENLLNLFNKSLIYQHYSERYVSCTHEDQMIKLDLIDKHS